MWVGRNAFRTSGSATGTTGAGGAGVVGAARRVAAKTKAVVRQRNMPSTMRSRRWDQGIAEFGRKAAIDLCSEDGKFSKRDTKKQVLSRRTILKKTPNNSSAEAHEVSLRQKWDLGEPSSMSRGNPKRLTCDGTPAFDHRRNISGSLFWPCRMNSAAIEDGSTPFACARSFSVSSTGHLRMKSSTLT